jgi:hypothetical protein
MIRSLIVERSSLPPTVLDWLEANEKNMGILLYREENGKVVLERLEDIDPAMLVRVRTNMQRYRPTLERLADS